MAGDRRGIEEALADSERRFQGTFEQAAVGMAHVRLDGRWLAVNERLCDLLGYRREDFFAKTFQDITHPDDLETDLEFARRLVAGEIPNYSMEKRYYRADGTPVWVNLTVSLVPAAEGEPAYFIKVVEDITGRKQVEEALRTSHRMTADILGQMTDVCLGLDRVFRYTYVNSRWEDTFGKVADQVVGKVIWDVFPSLVSSPVCEKYHTVLRERVECSFEFLSPVTGRWLLARAFPTEEGMAAYLLDIDDRKRSEEALREGEARFRTLADNIPQLCWMARPDGHIYWYNKRWYEYTGTTPEQMEGWGWKDVHYPEALPAVMVRWQASIASGEPFDMDFPLRGADGAFRQFLTRVMPVRGADGRVAQWFGTNTDIGDRLAMEKALREGEAKSRQLADAMPQIVWTARPDGYVDYYNERWYEFTGQPRGEGGDPSWEPILHPDDLARCKRDWYHSVRTGEPYQIEHRFLDQKTGRYRWHLGRAVPVRDEVGQVVRWFGTATDIDDQRRAKEEAEEANRAKDQFLAVLSHELRTPLNPILLAVSAMLDRAALPSEVLPTLEMIRRNVELEARLIDDLLDVTRIVRGKMALQWQVADGHALIQQAVQVCRGELVEKGMGLALELSARRHHVQADAARLQQVVWNLLKNAIKFTPAGGTITIRTRDDADPDGRLIVEVADTGIGIEPEVLPHIFDPFRQAETGIIRRYGGLGLGLAISKGVVEAHGGAIAAESRGKDQGATFRITLAAVPEPKPETRAGDGPTRGPSEVPPLKILLVEDDATTLRLMARLLRSQHHQVTTASTLESGLEAARAGAHDLLISDIGLPDGSGLDLMRGIVAALGPVPAIALTGFGMEEDIRRSRDAGFAAHMTKPIDFPKLEAVIRQVASGAAMRCNAVS